MKIKNFSIFLVLFLIFSNSKDMDAQKMEEKSILTYWIFSPSESKPPLEIYRLRSFSFDPSISTLYLNAGIEFYADQTVKKFRVILCGNDHEAKYKQGNWKIFKDKDVKKLKISFPKDEQLFEIIEISEDRLVLKRL